MDEIDTLFNCFFCNYNTNKKSNYDKHLLTSKHKVNCGELSHKEYLCETCNKHFNSSNSLWKHNSRSHPITNDEDKINKLTNLVVKVVEQNSYLSKQICQLATNTNNNINSHNNTTNNNNRFNINVYLNETCKNAMNIDTFVDSIQVGIEDLEETGRLGFVDGISRIIINNLNKIERPDRPIHCSDSKRLTFHIKDNDEWNKTTKEDEPSNNKIKTLIQTVAGKNIKQIHEWQKLNPEYNDPTSKCSDVYQHILFQIMNGDTVEESDENINKIIKNIAKETSIIKIS
jgi:Txe/YoeB family toxin of Txe-Axe toxin-antitoxin module